MEDVVIYENGIDVEEVAETQTCCVGRPAAPSGSEE